MEFIAELISPTLLLYVALGAFAGVMAGLLGVGGGLIIVPVLAWILHGQQVNDALVMHIACLLYTSDAADE